MDSIRKREEELFRRNEELNAKSGRATKNAEMILNSTTSTYKENSFLNNLNNTSSYSSNNSDFSNKKTKQYVNDGPENNDDDDEALIAPVQHETPPPSPYRKTPPISPQVQKAAKRSSEKRRTAAQQRKNSTTPSSNTSYASSTRSAGSSSRKSRNSDNITLDTTPRSGVMTEATFRYQKARIVVLEEECLRAKEAMKIAEKEKKMAVGNLSNLKSEKNKIDRKYEHCRSLYEKQKEENKKLSTSAKASEREVIKLRRELQDAIKATKKANAGGNNNQVRYNRVVEENERLREKVKDLEATIKDEGDSQKVQKEKLAGECRRLERQRNELLTAFKKQMKLIDILKRQKMHIESAKLLHFTEQEFSKALDITSNEGL